MFVALNKMLGFLNSFLPIFLMFHFLLQMLVWGTEQFVVLGPTEPIVALLGTDITLPCCLSPLMSAEDREVRWFRSHISEAVFVFQNSMEQAEEQLAEYMGRTELISDFITEGRLAVKIYNVQIFDNGEYRCFFKKGNEHQEAILEVKVASLGSAPQLHLAGYEDGGILLACTTDGWFPQPQVQCRDNKGRKLPALSETQAQDGDGFLHVKATIVVQENSVRNVSCSICNTLLGQEKMSVIDIPESFFPRTSPWKKALIGILSVLGILLGISMFLRLKDRKNLKRLQQKMEAEHEAKKKLTMELERRKKLYDSEWRKAHIYVDWRKEHFQALTLTLDPASAHHDLILTEMKKSMIQIQRKKDQEEENCSVLGKEPIISGRYYWEVKVDTGKKANWYLGICRENANRKGWIRESPEKGFWVVRFQNGKFQAMTESTPGEDSPFLGQPPQCVGIFLDHEERDISFYNMSSTIEREHTWLHAEFRSPKFPRGRESGDMWLPHLASQAKRAQTPCSPVERQPIHTVQS
ncbi:butyrophilin subfamily 3 member A2-like [Dromiciops gliroides]|uniref:butyrophilin subfamily 3 member A2-like n=1 Tax=Dromiciops gliroides TaxID=33562 RepID=UPI001CC5ABF3|nr:butyrophilin subfamily 3 member A2-like [Dromiciops gliroides]